MRSTQTLKCPRNTQTSAVTLLGTKPRNPFERIAEQIAKMGTIQTSQLQPGIPISKNKNEQIRIALVRPLGSLIGEEERRAVKEIGEPYQLELLAAVLKQAGYQVKIFDSLCGPYDPTNPENYPSIKGNSALVAEVEAYKPDVIGFSTFTYNFRKGLTIAAELKRKLEVPIIFGGYHTTSVGKQYLLFDSISSLNLEGAEVFKQDLRILFQHGIVDYACIGEGVKTVLDVIAILKGKLSPHEVKGIAFRSSGQLYISEADRLSLDDYPLPLRGEEYNPMNYYAIARGYPFFLLATANGCRFSCEYCSTGALTYPGLRFRSIDLVVHELRQIKDRFHSSWPSEKIMINIIDEDFAASPQRVIDLCNAIVDAGLNKYFQFNSFLDNLSILGPKGGEMLSAMHRAGFVFCFIGIESMLENALDGYKRPDRFHNRALQLQEAIDKMASHGLLYFGDHITSYPLHTIEDIKLDYERLLSLRRMHYAYFPILAPMPGTPLYWKVLWGSLGKGFLPGITYDSLDANHQVLSLPDGGQVKPVREEAIQRFFTRLEYEQEVDEAIKTDPKLALFFARVLPEISNDYPENTRLRDLAAKYTGQ